ncbi:MAG TPA: hypothetical protein VME66_16040 [Candidatus Acidoferrales bacterium]|nr:hypothetical protein [Candidatus Acidoferrales bacterium]
MMDKSVYRLEFYVVAFAVVFASAYLAWQATHGGVVSHHLLDRRDLPAFSNWWGLAIIPLTGGFAAWSVRRRDAVDRNALRSAMAAAFCALLAGVALSVAFIVDEGGNAPLFVLLSALACGFIWPTYRGEYIFGFVVGMSFTFGLVLPAIIALIAAALSAAFYFLVRPVFVRLLRRVFA